MDDDAPRFVEIGDEFALQTLPARGEDSEVVIGFVSAHGDIRVDFLDGKDMDFANPPRPHDCRFVLHPTNEYSASKMLRKGQGVAGTTEAEVVRLERAAELEKDRNDLDRETRQGHRIAFGSTCQLYSPGSDTYVEVEKRRAREDHFAQTASMVADGLATRTKHPWFRVMPGFATRTEDLESIKTSGSYLHCSLEDAVPSQSREVNVASFLTRFKVVPVATRLDVLTDCIRGGDFMQLYQRQSRGYLHQDHDGEVRIAVPEKTSAKSGEDSSQVNDLVTARADMTWQIELPMMIWSGAALQHSKGDRHKYYSIKETMSGMFLVQDSDGSLRMIENDHEEGAHWEFVSSDDSPAFQYELTSFYIQNRKTHRVLHRAEKSVPEDNGASGADELTQLWPVTSLHKANVRHDDLFVCRRLPDDLLGNFRDTQQTVLQLHRFHRQVRELIEAKAARQSSGESTEQLKAWDVANIEDLTVSHLQVGTKYDPDAPTIGRLSKVLVDISIDSNTTPLTRDGIIQPHVQDMLFEFRIVPLLLDVVDSVLELVPKEEIADETYGPSLLIFVKFCYRVLRQLTKQNSAVSRLLYGHLDRLVENFGVSFNVVDVVSEIFRDTPDLIRAAKPELVQKVWQLSQEQRDEMYINFLCVLLEGEGGVPIKANQDKVAAVITKNFPQSGCPSSSGFFDPEWSHLEGAERHDDKPEHAEFFFHAAIVNLASLLCGGRHRESIDFFLTEKQFGFTYLGILSRLTKGNPCPSTQVYSRLMRTLFVDREPYELYVPVQKARILPTVNMDGLTNLSRPKHVDPYENMDGVDAPTPYFTDLKEILISCFNRYHPDKGHTDAIGLVLGALELVKLMLLSGLYDGAFQINQHNDGVLKLGKESKALGEAIVPLLDGRLDDEDDVDLYTLEALMTMKRTILEVVTLIFNLRASSRIDVLITHFYSDLDSPPPSPRYSVQDTVDPTTIDPTDSLGQQNQGSIDAFEDESAPSHAFETEGNKAIPSVAMFDAEIESAKGTGRSESNTIGEVKNKNGKRKKNSRKKAEEVAELLASIRAFPPEQDEALAGILVDTVRLDTSVRFMGFETVISFLSQGYAFSKILGDVVLLSNEQSAQKYMSARAAISEFRRLRKWLHEPDQCVECVELVEGADGLISICSDYEGKNIVRCLNFEEYAFRVLRMRLNSDAFDDVMRSVLKLVASFCTDNSDNQILMSGHLDDIFIPLLSTEKYMDAAAFCIECIVGDNKELCLMLAPQLVQLAVDLTRQHGTHISLLSILKRLILCDGEALDENQTMVCKGVLVGDMLNLTGELDENEWGTGPACDRVEMLKNIIDHDQTRATKESEELYHRCRKEAEYYTSSLRILALCSSGTNPATGMMLASHLSFGSCVTRLHEIFDHPDLQSTEEDVTGAKYCTLSYFRDTFIETNAMTLMHSLTREANGLWSIDKFEHAGFATPIAESVLKDMEVLDKCHDGENCTLHDDDREYLFEQAIPFFISYIVTVSNYSATAFEENMEKQIKQSTFREISALMDRSLKQTGWSDHEKFLLETLSERAQQFQADVAQVKMVRLQKHTLTQRVRPEADKKLESILESVSQAMGVQHIKGTDRMVGVGIMRVASALWRPAPSTFGEPDQLYASYLVEPLRVELKAMRHSGNFDAVPSILTMIDAIRAIPYVINEGGGNPEGSFMSFVNVETLDATQNPDLSKAQTQLVDQGWGLLCFEILDEPLFARLHLVALRLLNVLTSAGKVGNPDCQRLLLRQVSESPEEVCASSLRKLIRASATDLKMEKKLEQAKQLEEERVRMGLSWDSHAPTDGIVYRETGYAVETMAVMMNLCIGASTGLQDYILRQPARRETLNLVVDLVSYLTDLERYLKDEVLLWTRDADAYRKNDHPLLDRAFGCFRVLIALCEGPNPRNQLAIMQADIIGIFARIFQYCLPSYNDVIASGKNSPKRKLNAQISRLLVTLMEGDPPQEVLRIMHRGIPWPVLEKILAIKRQLMTTGTITVQVDAESNNGNKKDVIVDRSANKGEERWKVSKEEQNASWISHDAFKFMSIYDKVYYYLQETRQDTDLVFDQGTIAYFQQRIGQVQIVRNDALERVFYWIPDQYSRPDKQREIDRKVRKVMDACPRKDPTEKLEEFQMGVMDIIEELEHREEVKDSPAIRLYPAETDVVLLLSFLSAVVLMVSWVPSGNIAEELNVGEIDLTWNDTNDLTLGEFDFSSIDLRNVKVSSGRSLDPTTYARWENRILSDDWPEMWLMHILIALAHLAICILGFNHFTVVSVPILIKRHEREQRKLHKRRTFDSSNRETFLKRAVHVYGIHDAVANSHSVKKAFSRYGNVIAVRVTRIAAGNSWAIVCFSSEEATEHLSQMMETGPASPRAEAAAKKNGFEIPRDKDATAGFISTKTGVTDDKGRMNKQEINLKVGLLTESYVESFGGQLAEQVEELEYEVSTAADESIGFQTAQHMQELLNFALPFDLGAKVPLQSMYVLRWNVALWQAVADIALSISGFVSTPLWFSWHLLRVTRWKLAQVVVQSITINVGKIGTTIVIGLLAMYGFAISGVLFFKTDHSVRYTSVAYNPEYVSCSEAADCSEEQIAGFIDQGPCSNLLSCFISYTFNGLTQSGLSGLMVDVSLPESADELATRETLRILWEVLFMLTTTCIVISIITGIICDTFRELRTEVDEARYYRNSTCFVTGIPYSTIEQETSTHELQYVYLLLYLEGKASKDMTPLEQYVSVQVTHGEIDWMPTGRSIGMQNLQEQGKMKENTLIHFRDAMELIFVRLLEMELKNKDIHDVLEALTKQLKLIVQVLGGEDGASAAIRASAQLGDAQSTIAKQELLIDNLRAECKTLQEKLKQKDKKRSKRKG